MYLVICSVCSKQFKRLFKESSRDICYSCALKEFAGNFAPEEGDFNSALITSGEMTELEWRQLQEGLRAVEEGRSIREPYCEEEDEPYDVWTPSQYRW